MSERYHRELFRTYSATHLNNLGEDTERKLQWFSGYLSQFYFPVFPKVSPEDASVLEIGCNRGYILRLLEERGYRNLVGVDLSPEDVATAQELVSHSEVICGDARELVANRSSAFDIIIMKAVLEHWPKSDVLPFLRLVHQALRPGGRLLVDVPNMDWLFATHERYMDFTHEVGFTQQSLKQVMRQVFPDVHTYPIDFVVVSRRQRLKLRAARWLLDHLLRWAHPEAALNPYWARSLLGVGMKR